MLPTGPTAAGRRGYGVTAGLGRHGWFNGDAGGILEDSKLRQAGVLGCLINVQKLLGQPSIFTNYTWGMDNVRFLWERGSFGHLCTPVSGASVASSRSAW
jgi:hypothetical protein